MAGVVVVTRQTSWPSQPAIRSLPIAPSMRSMRSGARVPSCRTSGLDQYLREHPVEEQGWEGAFTRRWATSKARASRRPQRPCQRRYTTAYLAHVPLETRCAIASWDGDRVTVWTGTQRPFGVREQIANELDIAPANVRVIVPPTGSGYGGKHSGEAAVEAVRLARARRVGRSKCAGVAPTSSPGPTSGRRR